MKQTLIALSISVIAPLSAWAGGPATGGASEYTQLMNNAELVSSVSEQMKTVQHTLDTYNEVKRALNQLSPDAVKAALGGDTQRYTQMVGLYKKVQTTSDSYAAASATIKDEAAIMRAIQTDPSAYISLRSSLASQKADIYAAQYEADKAKLQDAQRAGQDLQNYANSISATASTVEGLQGVMAGVAKSNAVLQSMQETIARREMLAASEKQEASNASKVILENEKRNAAAQAAAISARGKLRFSEPSAVLNSPASSDAASR